MREDRIWGQRGPRKLGNAKVACERGGRGGEGGGCGLKSNQSTGGWEKAVGG